MLFRSKAWSDVPEITSLIPPAPPPLPSTATFHYAGPDGSSQTLGAADIAQRVRADMGGRHLVWKEGFANWTDAKSVPEIAALLGGGPPPPPPPR